MVGIIDTCYWVMVWHSGQSSVGYCRCGVRRFLIVENMVLYPSEMVRRKSVDVAGCHTITRWLAMGVVSPSVGAAPLKVAPRAFFTI